MIIDKQNEFSDSQAVTTTAISTNVINTLPGITYETSQNLGNTPGALFLVIQVDTAFVGGTSLAVSVESDSTANLATSPTIHASTGAIPAATLVPGYQVVMPLPAGEVEKYLGLRYTAVGTFTGGAISAFLSRDHQSWRAYNDALT